GSGWQAKLPAQSRAPQGRPVSRQGIAAEVQPRRKPLGGHTGFLPRTRRRGRRRTARAFGRYARERWPWGRRRRAARRAFGRHSRERWRRGWRRWAARRRRRWRVRGHGLRTGPGLRQPARTVERGGVAGQRQQRWWWQP